MKKVMLFVGVLVALMLISVGCSKKAEGTWVLLGEGGSRVDLDKISLSSFKGVLTLSIKNGSASEKTFFKKGEMTVESIDEAIQEISNEKGHISGYSFRTKWITDKGASPMPGMTDLNIEFENNQSVVEMLKNWRGIVKGINYRLNASNL